MAVKSKLVMKSVLLTVIMVYYFLLSFSQEIEQSFIRRYNQSTFTIYNKILDERRNLVFLPVFLSKNFFILYHGSRGLTRQQLSYYFYCTG